MAPITPTIIRKPLLSIQFNWDEALREKDGSVWVSCKEIGNVSKHGMLCILESGDNNMRTVRASHGFKVKSSTQKSLTLLHEDPNCKCDFYAPAQVFSNIHKKSISCLDVSDAGLGISVCGDNALRIWDSSNGTLLRNLEGHIWDVYTCSFFPSGIVVLSAGADMQLKIWAADSGQCPVTLTGHTAAIVDTAIVEKGRNVVSVSKDGTARLWDCGKSLCLDIVSKENGNINCCDISSVDIDVGVPDNTPSEREIGTDGKLLLLGCESGCLKGVGLHSRKQVFDYKCDSAINCCCFVSSIAVAFGTQDGKIFLFDLRARLPVTVWEESSSPILCLIKVKNGLFSGRADGSCIFTSLDSDQSLQLTGPDFDHVHCMAFKGKVAYTGSRDGIIRKYELPF